MKILKPRISEKKKESGEERLNVKHQIKKYWYVFFLICIFAVSFWFRSFPARWNELIGLDEFHIYRIAEYALHNNLRIYDDENLDMMRYTPLGVSTWREDYSLPVYFPVLGYIFASAIGINMHFFEFAIIFPAFTGAFGAIIAFFIAKELSKSNVSGLFAAFFVSMTPALFTRTSAASFEKEATAVIFMMTTIWLFLKAYNKKGKYSPIIYGALSGISLGLMGLAWGGVQYIYLLFAAFFFVLFAANIIIVAVNYLFPGLGKHIKGIERLVGLDMIKAYVPMIFIGTLMQLATPHHIELTNMSILAAYSVAFVLLLRFALCRFGLVKNEKSHLVIPYVAFAAGCVFLVGVLLTDFFDPYIRTVSDLLSLSKSVVGSTVAENAPGDWGTILSTLGTGFSSGALPQLNLVAPYFALWIFMFLGVIVIAYEFYKTQNWLLVFPIVWLFSTLYSVFWMVRLLFIAGPAAGVVAGIFFGWLIEKIRGMKVMKKKGWKNAKGILTAILGLFIILLVVVNLASTYAYALGITPAICFANLQQRSSNPFDVEPCVKIDENGKQVLDPDQPWYQAMKFLSEQTPEDSVVLSWWDFGYWFQTRGNRASVADGGNLGGKYLRNFELADWYMDSPENWSAWVPWMKGYKVTHIFMDYTLPGKYGAISKIGSRGENVYGFLEFRRNPNPVSSPLSNTTVVEYLAGPIGPDAYYSIWLGFDDNGGLVGRPMFMIKQGQRYSQKNYINEFCTTSGIIRVSNETNAMPGCIAINTYLGKEGLFYVPPEIENTIFNRLMFMQGYGLPVEKVFDNGLIQIYKVNYENETISE
ncbi:MAG: STT3 domain-containing protein [Candidatus Aenigmatarchaeota archaeon]